MLLTWSLGIAHQPLAGTGRKEDSAMKNLLSLLSVTSMLLALTGCAGAPEKSVSSIDSSPFAHLYDGRSSTIYSTELPVTSAQEAIALGDKALLAGDDERALFQYVRALEMDAKNADTFYKIGAIHYQRGTIPLAGIAFGSAVRIDANHGGANEGLGLVYLKQRNYQAARRHLSKAVSSDSTRWRSHNALGVISDLEKDYAAAIAHYKAALAANADSPRVFNNLGYSRYLSGDLRQSVRDFRKAIELDPRNERAWRNLGLVYARQGQYAKAFDALKMTESEAEAYNDIGYICMVQGKYKRAAEFLELATETSPTYYATAHSNLQQVASLMGKR
jgi:Flp pilus assembly protein TadD